MIDCIALNMCGNPQALHNNIYACLHQQVDADIKAIYAKADEHFTAWLFMPGKREDLVLTWPTGVQTRYRTAAVSPVIEDQ